MNARRTLVLGWTTLLVACVVLGGLKNSQNLRFRGDYARYAAEDKESAERYRVDFSTAFHETLDLLTEAMPHDPPRRGWTREEVQAKLPGNVPFQTVVDSAQPGTAEADWTHPLSSQTWELFFDSDNRLTTWQVGQAAPRPQPAPVSSATFEDLGEQVRLAVGGWGKWLWIGLLAVGLFAGRFRRAVSHLLLAVVVSLTVADLVSPVYSLSTVFSNDVVYVDVLMIAISCAALVALSPVLRSLLQSRVLPRRFSARWQASSAAVLIALAAMGWYGQVIGSVLVTGAIAYLAFTAFLGPSPLPPNSSLSADPKAPEPGML